MIENPIVDEVHRAREQILARYGGDLRALVKDAQRRTEDAARAGRLVASPPRRTNTRDDAPRKKAG
ncbi:MAG: hypothetical protein ABSH20_11565 [Tepidisphaeraceae bacterium]|jgi:hypothetical protein